MIITAVMRPHVLAHPKHHHQTLPEVLMEEEVEESPLTAADDTLQVSVVHKELGQIYHKATNPTIAECAERCLVKHLINTWITDYNRYKYDK